MSVATDNFLAHHGVKGQKWGVVHEDPLTGRDHALLKAVGGDSDEASDRMKAMYGPGSNGEQPKKGLSSKQKKIIIGVGIGAIAAGTIAAGIYLNKSGKLPLGKLKPVKETAAFTEFMETHHTVATSRSQFGLSKEYVEKLSHDPVTMKAGSIFKRVSTEKEEFIRPGGFFASHAEDDVNRYKAVIPVYWKKWGLNAKEGFVVSLKAEQDVKAPSPRATFDLFKNSLDDHLEYDHAMGSYSGKLRDVFTFPAGKTFADDDEFARATFPLAAGLWTNSEAPLTKHFFDKVKGLGFNALVDMNDAGSIGDKPMRLIDDEIFSIAGHEKLTKEAIKQAQDKIMSLAHAFIQKFLTFTNLNSEVTK